jgi:predicted nucleic acid-binding protein
MIVVDASVFNKLFLDEIDKEDALALFRYSLENDVQLVAPNLLFYESLSAALHYEIPFEIVYQTLTVQRAAGMRLIEPSFATLRLAQKMASEGNKKIGYPSLQDSIYHAMAIELEGVFVTADQRHVAKCGHFGHVALLSEKTGWRNQT